VQYRFFNADQVQGFNSLDLFGQNWFFLSDQAANDSLNNIVAAGHYPMETAEDSAAVLGALQWADERSLQLFERSSGDKSGAKAVPMDTEMKRSLQLKLRADLAPGSVLRAMLLSSDRAYREFNNSWRYTPDARLFRYSRNQLTSLKWDKALNESSYFDLAISHTLNT
jgi:hypothetical protein